MSVQIALFYPLFRQINTGFTKRPRSTPVTSQDAQDDPVLVVTPMLPQIRVNTSGISCNTLKLKTASGRRNLASLRCGISNLPTKGKLIGNLYILESPLETILGYIPYLGYVIDFVDGIRVSGGLLPFLAMCFFFQFCLSLVIGTEYFRRTLAC